MMQNEARALNTLEMAKGFESVKFSKEQAEYLALVMYERQNYDHLATKEDLQQVEVALQKDIKQVEVALQKDIKQVEDTLQKDIKQVENVLGAKIDGLAGNIKMLQWLVGSVILAFLTASVGVVLRFLFF